MRNSACILNLNELHSLALDYLLDGMRSRAFMHMQKSIAKNVNWPNSLAFQKTIFLFCLWKRYCGVNLLFPNLMFFLYSATIKLKLVFTTFLLGCSIFQKRLSSISSEKLSAYSPLRKDWEAFEKKVSWGCEIILCLLL